MAESGILEHVVYLDARGSGKFRDILFEKIYRHKKIPAKNGEPARDYLREDLDEFSTFRLFLTLARQSGFPLPKTTGKQEPLTFERPSHLPTTLKFQGFSGGAYYDALDMLLNGENREIGYSMRTARGQRSGGNTSVNWIDEKVLTNLIDWMAVRLQDKEQLALPRITVTQQSEALTAEKRYRETGPELKQAFLMGWVLLTQKKCSRILSCFSAV